MIQSPREFQAAFRGRLFLSAIALIGLSAAALAPAHSAGSAAAGGTAGATVGARADDDARAGRWLLAGSPGARGLALFDCPTGREIARADLDEPLAAPSAFSATEALAWGVTRDRRLLAFDLPALALRHARKLPLSPSALAASSGRTDRPLVAVGGSGPRPLVVADARTLAEVYVHQPGKPTAVRALADVPGRAGFLAGLVEPAAPAEVWELAYAPDAPPVLKGLVHDYRMGEAVALPGRFTPRVAPVASPTAALLAGPVPYEWLRLDVDGRATVLHLEVRREIAAQPRPPAGPWLAAPWRGSAARGWLIGASGARELAVWESGSWRLERRIGLPGRLLAIAAFGDLRTIVAAVERGDGAALVTIDVEAQRVVEREGAEISGAELGAAARSEAEGRRLGSGRPRLEASADGRCLALIDGQDRWLAAIEAPPARAAAGPSAGAPGSVQR